jgi:hypothetical protein
LARPLEDLVQEGDARGAETEAPLRFDNRSAETAYPPPTIRSVSAVSAVGPNESAFLPLLNQFAMMQQQMFDQFQQAILQMVHVFGALHREQMDAISGELNDLRDLTRELQSLERQFVAAPPAGTGNQVATPAMATSLDASLDDSLANIDQLAAMLGDRSRPDAQPNGPGEDRRRNGAADESASKESEKAPSPPHASPEENDEALTTPRPATAGAEPIPKLRVDPRASAESSQEIHAFLCKRMATLQEERQSHWKKILGILTGAGREK